MDREQAQKIYEKVKSQMNELKEENEEGKEHPQSSTATQSESAPQN